LAFSSAFPVYKPLDKVLNVGGIYACWEEVFEFFDEMGDDVDTNEYRWRQKTLLEMAVQSRNLLVARRLLQDYGSDPDLVGSSDGITPLMQACRAGDDAMAIMLIMSGADILARDAQGKSALQHSIEEDNYRMERFLTGFLYEKLCMSHNRLHPTPFL
jgi:hypothetical protein